MPDFDLRHFDFKVVLKQWLCAGLLISLPLSALADVAHFRNGKSIRGKLNAMTGDIIDFKADHSLGSQSTLKRLELNNRCDVVETRNHRLYFGELVYVDTFKMEMKTATGTVKVNRLMVKNVVLGSPAGQVYSPNQAGSILPDPSSAQSGEQPAAKPAVVPLPAVDQD